MRSKKKLAVKKDSLKQLTQSELKEAVGGAKPGIYVQASASCYTAK